MLNPYGVKEKIIDELFIMLERSFNIEPLEQLQVHLQRRHHVPVRSFWRLVKDVVKDVTKGCKPSISDAPIDFEFVNKYMNNLYQVQKYADRKILIHSHYWKN